MPGDPYEVFRAEGIRTITNRELPSPDDTNWSRNQGTYRVDEDGTVHGIASPAWNWGAFYEKVLTTILTGAWDALASKDGSKAVSYWWGLNSGVIDVQLSPELPDGIRCRQAACAAISWTAASIPSSSCCGIRTAQRLSGAKQPGGKPA